MESEVRGEVENLLHRSPWEMGVQRSRWRLQDIGRALAWLKGYSEAGIYKVLKRLGFSRKQALYFVYSPDVDFRSKWQSVLRAYADAVNHPEEAVILFLDELTYYRRPTKAPAYHRQSHTQPLALEAARYNTQTRLLAALDGLTGRVLYMQRHMIGKEALVAFYAQVRAAYPSAQRIFIVQDNWPTHKSVDVLHALQFQRLTPLFMPVYASWLNPIEKLWRWLKQDILHLHRLAHDLDSLRQQVIAFLDGFKFGSEAVLRYVGLLLD